MFMLPKQPKFLIHCARRRRLKEGTTSHHVSRRSRTWLRHPWLYRSEENGPSPRRGAASIHGRRGWTSTHFAFHGGGTFRGTPQGAGGLGNYHLSDVWRDGYPPGVRGFSTGYIHQDCESHQFTPPPPSSTLPRPNPLLACNPLTTIFFLRPLCATNNSGHPAKRGRVWPCRRKANWINPCSVYTMIHRRISLILRV